MTDPLEAKLQIAEKLRDEGRFEEAIGLLRLLRSSCENPQDEAQLLLFEAESLVLMRDFAEASEVLLRAKQLDPQNAFVSGIEHEMAAIDRAQGRLDEALARTQALLRSHPPESDARWLELLKLECGFLLAELGRWNEAIPILLEARNGQFSEDYQIAYQLGRCYVSTDNFEPAIENLSQALAQANLPEDCRSFAYLDRAVARYQLKEYREAVVDLDSCMRLEKHLDPVSRQTLYLTWAYCLRAMGRPTEATEKIREGGMIAE